MHIRVEINVKICQNLYTNWKNNYSHKREDRFEIQITVVAQGGIKFFFLKILKILKISKILRQKK